jgi:hypothetical protein
MSGITKIVLGSVVWGLFAYGTLCLGQLPGDFGESLCGVWGCLPPLQALAAMHLLWLLLLAPLIVLGTAQLGPRFLRFAGMLLVSGSVLAIAVVAGLDLLDWFSRTAPEFHVYWPRRTLYTLLTLSDVPFFQLLIAGAICWASADRRLRAAPQLSSAPVPATQPVCSGPPA